MAYLGSAGRGGGIIVRASKFSRGLFLVARVFTGFLQMYVELLAALKILENFLFMLKLNA